MPDDGLEQLVDVVGAHQLGGRLQGVEPGVVAGIGHGAHLFDGDTVDLAHLGDQQVDQGGGWQLDHELVDRLPVLTLEDVDSHDVTADRTDAAGDLPQGAGPVGQPHADDERRPWKLLLAIGPAARAWLTLSPGSLAHGPHPMERP